MEIALTNDEEIIMILSRKIYIPEIVYKIIQWKHKLEDKNTLNYHIERWETISSKYFYNSKLTPKVKILGNILKADTFDGEA